MWPAGFMNVPATTFRQLRSGGSGNAPTRTGSCHMTKTNHPVTHVPAMHPATTPCPTNQQVGPKLDTLTVKSLVAVPLTAVSADEAFRFCPAPREACPTA